MGNHLFVISKEVLSATSWHEIEPTAKAMAEVDVFKPPFEIFELNISANISDILNFIAPKEPFIGPDEDFPLILKYNCSGEGVAFSFVISLIRQESFKALKNMLES